MKKINLSVKFKIASLSLSILFIVVFIMTSISLHIVNNEMENQLEVDGMILAQKIAKEVENSQIAEKYVEKSLEEKIRTCAYLIGKNPNISNEYLQQLSQELDLFTIQIFDENNKVIYSNLLDRIGSVCPPDHPMAPLFESGTGEIMEPIRESKNQKGLFLKLGAVALSPNRIIQIGIDANKVNELKSKLGKQKIIEDLSENKNILYTLFIDKNLKIVAHTDQKKIGSKVDDIGSKTAAIDGKPHSNVFQYKPGVLAYDVLIPIYENGQHIGAVDVGLSLENLNNAKDHILTISILLGCVSFLIAGALLLLIIRKIISPLRDLSSLAEKTSDGDLNEKVNIITNDEIGLLGNSFNHMIDSLREMIQKIKDISSTSLSDTKELVNISLQVEDVSEQIASATQNIAEGAEQQALSMNEASINIQNVMTHIEDVHSEISKVVGYSDETNKVISIGEEKIDNLATQMDKIKDRVYSSSQVINELELTSTKIGDIVDMINEIANQTNLLALNASIEAARAGEAGRGFAVVAEEIRKLAEESMNSADHIKNLILNIQDHTKKALTSIGEGNQEAEAGKFVLEEVLQSFKNIIEGFQMTNNSLYTANEKVILVNEKSQIITKSIEDVRSITEQFSANTEEVAASTEEQTASMESMVKTIQDLEENIQNLELAVQKFDYKQK
ncbi:methyl-accepting chemotaxis protein [Inediibacterium massiliense]|uniref:methyl-accepting chemotaxis protein n=1 Tax=Inediibacterium massiliense TaxID=1658111 RepID=UPI0006B61ACA|nr:methyl-accepting chemotaxis protein [Inediibacterium massiliense]